MGNSTKAKSPRWTKGNLEYHHKERLRKDPGCFEDLLGISGLKMTEDEYKERSQAAVVNAWAEYEGIVWSPSKQAYEDKAAYFVDEEMVLAITDLDRSFFTTCYHEHYDVKHNFNQENTAPYGNQRLRYREWIQNNERGKRIKITKKVKGL
jgi:hypothetical protein